MVFVGVLDHLPNIQGLQWFCQTVFPRLRDLYPNARLDIVGRRPTAEVNALNQIPGVHVIGEVADVRPYVLASHFAIAPLLIARGIQNKVLEALACGRPVVATPDAATGIDSLRGIFVASPVPEEWLKQIERLQDPGVSAQASAWARNDTVDHYGWEAKLGPLLDLVGINGDPSRSMNRGSR